MKDYEVLLEKFWKGTASEPEQLQLYKMMVEQEDVIKDALQREYEQGSGKPERLTADTSKTILEALHREIGNRAAHAIDMPQRRNPRLFRWAAALVVAGLASFFTWQYYPATPADKAIATTAASYRMIDNDGAGIKELVMSDGSGIRLYPGSSIRFLQPFHTRAVRSISLKGKAEFKVQHDAAKIFEVITGKIRTTDIGTEFTIDAPHEHSFRLALKEGSVRVAAMPGSGLQLEDMILRPGDEARWDDTGGKMILAKAPPKQQVATPNHNTPAAPKERLVFDKTPLADVFARLETSAQVRITFPAAAIKELTFTGTIEPTDAIETALTIICNLNGLNYQKTKQAYIISRNK